MINGEGKDFTVVRFAGTDDEVSSAWREYRLGGVGGSDVAALMGISRYRTPYEAWAIKTGVMAEPDISSVEAVEWGNILEPVVGAKYARNHPDRKVERVNGVCESIARPWARASLDYQVKDEELGWGVLEIKTVGFRRAADWEDGVPIYYQTQVMHYLDVTNRPFADVAALIGGQEYREYRIMRDEDDIAAVRCAVDAFWEMVKSGEPPAITGGSGEASAILYNHANGDGYRAPNEHEKTLVARYVATKQAKEYAESAYTKACNELMDAIGDGKGFDCKDFKVTWSRFNRTSFDKERFVADHASLYDEYCTSKLSSGGVRYTRKGE